MGFSFGRVFKKIKGRVKQASVAARAMSKAKKKNPAAKPNPPADKKTNVVVKTNRTSVPRRRGVLGKLRNRLRGKIRTRRGKAPETKLTRNKKPSKNKPNTPRKIRVKSKHIMSGRKSEHIKKQNSKIRSTGGLLRRKVGSSKWGADKKRGGRSYAQRRTNRANKS